MTVEPRDIDPTQSVLLPSILTSTAGDYVPFYLRLSDEYGNDICEMDPYNVA